MANSVLSAPHFQDESAAFEYVEAHLWPRGPVCPHCGERKKIGRLNGATTRAGLRKCYACRKPFTVRIGSIFEDSKLALHLWLQVIHLMCASKKGISTRQIQRMLQCSMKTAWHLTHRIRHAMSEGGANGPLGGAGKVVEVEETYFGDLPRRRLRCAARALPAAIAVKAPASSVAFSRWSSVGARLGRSTSNARPEDVTRIVRENVAKESRLHTDESRLYFRVGREFAAHEKVNHSKKEYARGDVTTNTIEGFFSVFKRGRRGVYQQCSEQHLHRYLAEFDFRYNARQSLGVTDQQRASRAVMGAKGKRLTYETVGRSE